MAQMSETLAAIHTTFTSLSSAAPEQDARLDELELKRDRTLAALRADFDRESAQLSAMRRAETESLAERRRREDAEREARRRKEDDEIERHRVEEDEKRGAMFADETGGVEDAVDGEMEVIEMEVAATIEKGKERLAMLEAKRKVREMAT